MWKAIKKTPWTYVNNKEIYSGRRNTIIWEVETKMYEYSNQKEIKNRRKEMIELLCLLWSRRDLNISKL